MKDSKLKRRIQSRLAEDNHLREVDPDDLELRVVCEKIELEMPKVKETDYEVKEYIHSRKGKSWQRFFYNGMSALVYMVSPILSLIGLLVIALQTPGLINLFYLLFCLWHIH